MVAVCDFLHKRLEFFKSRSRHPSMIDMVNSGFEKDFLKFQEETFFLFLHPLEKVTLSGVLELLNQEVFQAL